MPKKQAEHRYDPHFPHPKQNFGKKISERFMVEMPGVSPGPKTQTTNVYKRSPFDSSSL
jgi:hypothetical protein